MIWLWHIFYEILHANIKLEEFFISDLTYCNMGFQDVSLSANN